MFFSGSLPQIMAIQFDNKHERAFHCKQRKHVFSMCECFVFLSQRGSRCRTPSLFVQVLGVSQRLFSSYANGVA